MDRTGITEPSVEVRGLDVGKYYWRVAAVDKDNAEEASRTSRASRSAGPRAGPVAPAIRPHHHRIDRRAAEHPAGARTDGAGATLTVNGQRVDVASDGAFNEFIQLPAEKPGTAASWSSAPIGINGGVAETKRPVMVGE